MSKATSAKTPLVNDRDELLRLGIVSGVSCCSQHLPASQWQQWAERFAQVTPEIMFDQGDHEYAFYRNLRQEADVPFDTFLELFAETIQTYFGVQNPLDELRLDDAFLVSYNTDIYDTRGPKHMDPSDITVNICVTKSSDTRGSYVLFHGTKALVGMARSLPETTPPPTRFLVNQEPLCATLHWGNHPHETTALESGLRTNIILTYCFVDQHRSDVALRSCYTV